MNTINMEVLFSLENITQDNIDDSTKEKIISVKNDILKTILQCSNSKIDYSKFIKNIVIDAKQNDDYIIICSNSYIKNFLEMNYSKDFIRILSYYFNLNNSHKDKIDNIKKIENNKLLELINEWCKEYSKIELELLNYKIETTKKINENPNFRTKLNSDIEEKIRIIENILIEVIRTCNDTTSKNQAQIFFGGFVENFVFCHRLGIASYIYEKSNENYLAIKNFFEIQ